LFVVVLLVTPTFLAILMLVMVGLVNELGLALFSDFSPFYLAGGLALEGRTSELYDPAQFFAASENVLGHREAWRPFWYSPAYLLLLLPFALAPLLLAVATWAGFNILTLGGCLLLGRVSKLQTLAVLLFPGTVFSVFQGQNGAIISGLLAAALLTLRSNPILAGFLLGLATIKPQMGLLIPVALLAAREWKVIASAAATTVLVVACSMGVFGIELWFDHVDAILRADDYLAAGELPLPYMITVLSFARQLGFEHETAQLLQAVAFLCSAALVFRVWSTSSNERFKISVLIIATFLGTPYGYVYDLPLLGLLVVWWAAMVIERPAYRGEQFAVAFYWLLPFLSIAGTIILAEQFWPVALLVMLFLLWRRFGAQSAQPKP
jgi:hypothetical protein